MAAEVGPSPGKICACSEPYLYSCTCGWGNAGLGHAWHTPASGINVSEGHSDCMFRKAFTLGLPFIFFNIRNV